MGLFENPRADLGRWLY